METNVKLELKVKMGNENISGTGRMGYLPDRTTYEEVCKVFGLPEYLEDVKGYAVDKIKAQWTGRINGLIFTIYDYKSDVEVAKNKDWHIGGHKELTVDLLKAYFEAKLKI
jgi:hypothetical protein